MARKPRNDNDEPLASLGAAMVEGPSASIENAEARGQAELVASEVIPTELHCTVEELTALGFELGEVDADDPMFRACKLPEGWAREGSGHSMWSFIVDEQRRHRVAIFYKAAFYDRRAHASIESMPCTTAQLDAAEAFSQEVHGQHFLGWSTDRELDGDTFVVTLRKRQLDPEYPNPSRCKYLYDEEGEYVHSREEVARFALDGSRV